MSGHDNMCRTSITFRMEAMFSRSRLVIWLLYFKSNTSQAEHKLQATGPTSQLELKILFKVLKKLTSYQLPMAEQCLIYLKTQLLDITIFSQKLDSQLCLAMLIVEKYSIWTADPSILESNDKIAHKAKKCLSAKRPPLSRI